MPLSAISIPGTHDSCTKNVALSYIFRCQDTDIATQLQNGYRYLDLRLVLDEGDDGNALVIKHNFATCRKGASWFSDPIYLEDVLADVYAFLEEHPTETVILCMKAENGDDNISVLQDLLYQQIEAAQDLWYLKNEIPDLDEVRGKIVLATRFEDALEMGDSRRGLNFGWIDQGDREIVDIPYVLSMINDTQVLWVQDRYNYNISDKLDAIYDDLENCQADENTFSLNFTSTSGSGKVGHPKRYADAINEELLSYDWQQGTCYGIVVVDFATEDLARCIFETN
jgi:1-phosphatidylinositol phosphodiesterase